ncbi:hypothetical protein SAMN05421774_101515 [Gemmobacter megaterium]|uniref:Uncharacterized protein n=1 Tax=Gemmobacter megaterium TaxID=1086013 RepID=A0A1N7KKU9_9RHOB|nr:hypothetical protein SAMN05421774_101515 [Gemmobacter megaterium]
MQMFSRKPPFDLAEFLAKPATPAEIKRAADARRRHVQYMQRLEDARERSSAKSQR